MKKSTLIKTLTLVSFFSLITVFILVKTGYINNVRITDDTYLQLSPNGGVINSTNAMSVAERDSANQAMMMSSSKSAAPPDITIKTIPKRTKDSLGDFVYDSAEARMRMYSSKSAVILEKIIINDSTFYKVKRKK